MISHCKKDQVFTVTIFTDSSTLQEVRNRESQDDKTSVRIMVVTQICRLTNNNSSVNRFRLDKIVSRETIKESKSKKRNKRGWRGNRKKKIILTHIIPVNQWASSKICQSQNQEAIPTHFPQLVVLEAPWWTSQKIRKQSDWMLPIHRHLLSTSVILTAMRKNQTQLVSLVNWTLQL